MRLRAEGEKTLDGQDGTEGMQMRPVKMWGAVSKMGQHQEMQLNIRR